MSPNRTPFEMNDNPLKNKIMELIENTSDPLQKAHLIIMLQMCDLLSENTNATRQVSEDFIGFRRSFADHTTAFSKHAQDEEVLIAKGQTTWKITARILTGLQVVVLAVVGLAWNEYKAINGRLVDIEKTLVISDKERKELYKDVADVKSMLKYPNTGRTGP